MYTSRPARTMTSAARLPPEPRIRPVRITSPARARIVRLLPSALKPVAERSIGLETTTESAASSSRLRKALPPCATMAPSSSMDAVPIEHVPFWQSVFDEHASGVLPQSRLQVISEPQLPKSQSEF